ncbi:MAG: methylated-DNA--[protein]-cysteine S-methyltransferase [Flexilinea sp.]
MLYSYFYETPVGQIQITENGAAIISINFPGESCYPDAQNYETDLLRKTAGQLKEFFEGRRKEFDLPLAPAGTPFMEKVWDQLQKINYGETCSYKDIAGAIENPKAVRAVGMANHRNPIPIIIPCHRVIGANGSLVGYGGGLPMKKFLLDLEKSNA